MRPWHRDVLLLAGLAFFSTAAFMASTVVGFVVLGVECVGMALTLSWALTVQKEDGDGN